MGMVVKVPKVLRRIDKKVYKMKEAYRYKPEAQREAEKLRKRQKARVVKTKWGWGVFVRR